MPFLSFEAYPLWLNALVFLMPAGTIWFVGVRLERYADTISERTGLGQAFTGMLLLAGRPRCLKWLPRLRLSPC